jgi:metallophosphoesterase (TIGR03767 family)
VQISRRDLFRSSAAIGGVVALGGFGGLASEAVAGTVTRAGGPTTRTSVLLKGDPDPTTKWRPISAGPGEPYKVLTSLGVKAKSGRAKRRKGVLAFAQLSDVHICDSQSPMRLDYLDRNDDDNNDDGHNDGHGTYKSAWRPQEILGAHVANSMVRTINGIAHGPVTGKPIALAIQTGDNSDNGQYNEIRWNIDVLDGGEVQVDSGDLTRYEGVMDNDPAYYDVRYWHPDGTPEGLEDDLPRSKFGFPTVPGLLDAARAPFDADGLAMPWYSAFGNHDPLVQGNWVQDASYRAKALGTTKQITPGVYRTVTADPDRRLMSKKDWIEEHFQTTGLPVGHGFKQENRDKGTGYYTFDKGLVRFVVMDTVNPNGQQNGSIDGTQLKWLKGVLAKSKQRLVVLASHHTLTTMNNAAVGAVDNKLRILGPEILALLLKNENVIAWVNGHTHTNHIWAHKRKGGGGFWEINTASHIDWPQQARLVEISNNKDGTLSIFTTMIDHEADLEFSGDLEDPTQLAALSRELAANDWQEQESDRRGALTARNVELLVGAPAFLR